MKFSKRMDRFGDEIFAALNQKKKELADAGRTVYNLSVGTPDFETPEHIKKAVAETVMESKNWHYSLGDLPELLSAVCDYYFSRFGV